uniref:Uncharacterized protein n=1 Tax=Hucho hucho TaxID=62062 RepID=A0A4W5MKB6_9TELE
MEFVISTTWNSLPVDHEPVKVTFSPGDGGMKMQVSAPFFNDPPGPSGPPGQPFPGLWDYEGRLHFSLSLTRRSHLLEYFQDFHLQSIMGEDWVQPESDLWKGK